MNRCFPLIHWTHFHPTSYSMKFWHSCQSQCPAWPLDAGISTWPRLGQSWHTHPLPTEIVSNMRFLIQRELSGPFSHTARHRKPVSCWRDWNQHTKRSRKSCYRNRVLIEKYLWKKWRSVLTSSQALEFTFSLWVRRDEQICFFWLIVSRWVLS